MESEFQRTCQHYDHTHKNHMVLIFLINKNTAKDRTRPHLGEITATLVDIPRGDRSRRTEGRNGNRDYENSRGNLIMEAVQTGNRIVNGIR